MVILKADGSECTRDPRGTKLRLADVYKTPDQNTMAFMAEVKLLTDADLADFKRWFSEAGYPCL